MATGSEALPLTANELTLDTLPPHALAIILSHPSLVLSDLVCVRSLCRSLRAATSALAPVEQPLWLAVRKVGDLPSWEERNFDIKDSETEEKHEKWYPQLHSDCCYKYPALTARQHFENAEWKAALLDDAHEDLRLAGGYEGSVPGKLLLSELAARWEAMSYRERQPYEAEHAAHRAAEDACRFAGGASEVSLLNALLLRSPGVRMLSLRDIPWHGREWAQTPELQPEYLLRRIGAAWVELRVIHLGRASVATTDIHGLVAACPQLAELTIDEVHPTDGDEGLFRGLVPHAALRYVSLPSLDGNALLRVVVRLLRRCPGLSQINAWKQSCRTEDDVWLVTYVARVAKARGLCCFTSRKCIEYGNLYDSNDSADSDGNYNGDGNVIKYVVDDDDDAFDAYASDSDED